MQKTSAIKAANSPDKAYTSQSNTHPNGVSKARSFNLPYDKAGGRGDRHTDLASKDFPNTITDDAMSSPSKHTHQASPGKKRTTKTSNKKAPPERKQSEQIQKSASSKMLVCNEEEEQKGVARNSEEEDDFNDRLHEPHHVKQMSRTSGGMEPLDVQL